MLTTKKTPHTPTSVTVRLTNTEHKALARLAEAKGMSIPALMAEIISRKVQGK